MCVCVCVTPARPPVTPPNHASVHDRYLKGLKKYFTRVYKNEKKTEYEGETDPKPDGLTLGRGAGLSYRRTTNVTVGIEPACTCLRAVIVKYVVSGVLRACLEGTSTRVVSCAGPV